MTPFVVYPTERIKRGLADCDYLPILEVNAAKKNNPFMEFLFCVLGFWLLVNPFLAYFLHHSQLMTYMGWISVGYIMTVIMFLKFFMKIIVRTNSEGKAEVVVAITIPPKTYAVIKQIFRIFNKLNNQKISFAMLSPPLDSS